MIRILRPTGIGGLLSGHVFDNLFTRNLSPELSVEPVDLTNWLDAIFGHRPVRPDDRAVQKEFFGITRGFDFLCPNYVGIPVAPLLLYLRNRSGATVRLLLIAHAPGAYALEWALLRPLLRSGDIIIAPTHSARDVIEFLIPEAAAHVHVIPHPMLPLPRSRSRRRPHIVSLARIHPSKLLHRQIEAMAVLRDRGLRGLTMRIAGRIREPGEEDTYPYARSLEAKISRLRLGDCVELIGEIAGEKQKGLFLDKARLLVNLSVTIEESFGKAIAEALGASVPVLATRWNGFPETIGAAGRCVPVDTSLLGVDVPADRIADGIQSLLDAPPDPEICRHEALRCSPSRVRRLYRETLAGTIEAGVGAHVWREIPGAAASAAPATGLLAGTAPLQQYSWLDLFQAHLTDVDRLRASLGGLVHRDTSDADELRSLLILGVRAPVSRLLAGVSRDGMDRPVGTKRGADSAGDLWERIAAGALSQGTLSSRLACLSLLARSRRVNPLRRGLEALRSDRLRSWGIDHIEIEALRLEGHPELAFQMSIAQNDPFYWGELAAERLCQLAVVCREWGRPELAVPRLNEWLGRFPDSPDSAAIQLELAQTKDSISRVESFQRKLPWGAVAEKVGSIRDIKPIGRFTFMIRAGDGQFVLKQMREDQDPDAYLDVLTRLAQPQHRFCPRTLGAITADPTCWYAVFQWVDGRHPSSAELGEDEWQAAVDLLKRLKDCRVVPGWRLEAIWLDRLKRHVSVEPAAAFVLDSLRRHMPEGVPTLAHGDFAPQNFVYVGDGIVLVDWEEIGSASPGFDAGWMLAHARLRGGERSPEEMLKDLVAAGFSRSNLLWFERLGLLRLLFRARTLPMEKSLRRQVRAVVRLAVEDCAAGMGWIDGTERAVQASSH